MALTSPLNVPDVVTNPYASAQMALNYGPQTQQTLRRSQYLADALRQMATTGSQNIRSPGELGAKLLATAILQRSNNRAQDALIQAMTQDRSAFDQSLIAGTPIDPSAKPPVAAAPPIAPPPAATPAAPASAPAAPTPAAAPQPSDADRLDIARAVYGEARGEPVAGQQGVAAVILNRARESGQPIHAVVSAPHQFSGYNTQALAVSPDQLQPIMANIGPVLSGATPDPTGGADHFFNPGLANPSWGRGPGQMIGQHKFMALGYGGGQPGAQISPAQAQAEASAEVAAHQPSPGALMGGGDPTRPPQAPQLPGGGVLTYQPGNIAGASTSIPDAQMTGGAAPQGPLQISPTMAAAQSQGSAQPYQIAANGQAPPPPQAAPSMQPPSIPHQVVTPEEWQQAAALLGNWRTHDLGVQKLMELKFRAAQAIEPPKNMTWDPSTGRAIPIPGTQYSQLQGANPSDAVQADPFGQITHQKIPGVEGDIPPGYQRGAGGALVPMGAPPTPMVGAPANAPQIPGRNAPLPVALQKPYMDLLDAWHKGPGYQDYVNSVNAANALETNLRAAAGNNGVVSQAVTDNLIRAMTGLSARQGSVNSMLEHLPWSDQLKGFISRAIGPENMNGFVTPTVLQQMRTAIHAYAEGHRQLAEQEYGQYNGAANRMGFDLSQDLPTIQDAGPVKWLDAATGANQNPTTAARQAFQGRYWKGQIDSSKPLGDPAHPFIADTPQVLQSLDKPQFRGKHVITPDGQMAVIE